MEDRREMGWRVEAGRAADGVTQAQPEHNPVTSYPFDMPAINQLILHQRILGAVSQLVRQPASKLRLCGSSLSGKFGPDEPSAGKAFEFSWANKEGNQPMHQVSRGACDVLCRSATF